MNALLLVVLLCNPTAIEFAWAQATADAPAEVSVLAPKVEPQKAPATRQETRYRDVEVKECYRDRWGRKRCRTRVISEAYTVTVQVPAASAAKANWPSYPITPRQRAWTQGGRHITWRHLTTGQHAGKFDSAWLQSRTQAEIEQIHADDHENKVQWAYVVRP